MLFSSLPFIFGFLPLLLFFWRRLSQSRPSPHKPLRLLFLFFSLAFYALWGAAPLCLFLAMISLNYLAALAMQGMLPLKAPSSPAFRKSVFTTAILINLASLLWFKYSPFIIENLALFFHKDWNFIPPALPLGISFYTFIQIAWLYDVYKNAALPQGLARHALFSGGFPWMISGPIIREKEIGWRLDALEPLSAAGLAKGFSLFSIGLAKKIVLADSCGLFADNVFNAASNSWPLRCAEAWAGSFFYTFQLYFDFSGYTDMALGLGLIMGLSLPENFNSPYKASGIIEFWRRWHITLGAWLRDFIYFPLGGNRKGKARQYLNLFLTMLIGGAWHGAGWTYIIWGALHGLMLAGNHAFRSALKSGRFMRTEAGAFRSLSILITFLCVNLCWVIFRSPDLDCARRMLSAMLSFTDFSLFSHNYFSGAQPWILMAACALICFAAPASQRIIHAAFDSGARSAAATRLWAAFFAALAFAGMACSGRQSSFLYFQF